MRAAVLNYSLSFTTRRWWMKLGKDGHKSEEGFYLITDSLKQFWFAGLHELY